MLGKKFLSLINKNIFKTYLPNDKLINNRANDKLIVSMDWLHKTYHILDLSSLLLLMAY